MFEKRKNSQKRTGFSIVAGLVLILAGIFAGFNLGNLADDEPIVVEEARPATVDLSGEWIGTTTQDYDDDSRYDYRIVIEQKGTGISGMSYLDMINDYEIYAEERIGGYVNGDTVVYDELETLVLDNISMDHWCHTRTTLTYQVIDGQETLVGSWEYVLDEERCEGISGRVILTRQAE